MESILNKDPVCGMPLKEEEAAGTIEYERRTYYFCSPSCKAVFGREPEKYATTRTHGSRYQYN